MMYKKWTDSRRELLLIQKDIIPLVPITEEIINKINPHFSVQNPGNNAYLSDKDSESNNKNNLFKIN